MGAFTLREWQWQWERCRHGMGYVPIWQWQRMGLMQSNGGVHTGGGNGNGKKHPNTYV